MRSLIVCIGLVIAAGCQSDAVVGAPTALSKNLLAGSHPAIAISDGLQLSRGEKAAIMRINRRYNEQFNAISDSIGLRNTSVDRATLAKFRALRTRQISEIKVALSMQNSARFEANLAAIADRAALIRARGGR